METDESRSDRKATARATTKLAVHMVKETSDALPPLKSVMAGLSVILDHCEVRSTSHIPLTHDTHSDYSKARRVVKR